MGVKPIGRAVAVIGGGLVGCELAYWLCTKGHEVTIVEMLPNLMQIGDVAYPNKMMLLELLALHKTGVLTGAKVLSLNAGGVSLRLSDGEERTIQADSVITATGYRRDRALYDELRETTPEIYVVGDAMRPLNIKNAVWSAYEVARKL